MSKEKQIEEMAMAIYENTDISCVETADEIAEALYNAGYRKQSEGKWISELVKKCDWKGKERDYFQANSCSLCHEPAHKRTSFCSNCGAKMKGGAE